MPGVVDNTWTATAEQAMDGLEIRAVLTYADPDREPVVSEVRTVHEDDHGGAARQRPTVGGATRYAEGDTVTLTRQLPDNGATILTTHRWERKAAGAADWSVVDDVTGTELSFPATLADDGAQYRVSILTPDGEVAYGPSPAVELRVDDATADPTVDFTSFPEEFVHGQQYTLTAAHTGSIAGASYRWEMLQTGATDWYTISNAEGPIDTAELTFTAQQAWDGFKWRVVLLDAAAERVAVSVEREMHVSLPTPTEDGLHILGLAGHYHSNNPITLNAVLMPEDDAPATYRWSTKRADQATFHVVDDQSGATFTATAEQALNGTQVKVERLVAGSVTATSEPVTVVVDDHGAAAPQVVSIAGPTSYDEGETATLTAAVAPASVLDHYQWYLTPAGSQDAEPIAGATSATYSFTAAAQHDGAALTVAVTGEDGAVVYGPSQPSVLSVAQKSTPAPDPEPAATTVTATDVTQVYGTSAQLVIAVSPTATGTLAVTAGSQTVTGTLSAGRATVTLPAKVLEPGSHQVSVAYAGVPGEFQPSQGTATVTVVKATPTVKVAKTRTKVKRGKVVAIKITVTAPGVAPTGKVTVRVAGKARTVKLNKRGRATVRISLPRHAKTGSKRVKVSYGGDEHVDRGKATTRIRLIR